MSKYNTVSYNLIYVYSIPDENHKGLLKIGKASFNSNESVAQLTPMCPCLVQCANIRIMEQTKTALVNYKLEYAELAVLNVTMNDGSVQLQSFDDFAVHEVLYNSGYSSVKFTESGKPSEWFSVDLNTAKAAIKAVKDGVDKVANESVVKPTLTEKKIKLRDEQEENVVRTMHIFKTYDTMLWDCKMRYGKTVTAYELIRRMNEQGKFNKVIVVTHRPAVEDGWGSDHDLIFNGTNHKFIDKTNGKVEFEGAIDAENDRQLKSLASSGEPFTYFASIQDLRGSARVGGKFNKNNAVFDMDWDLLIIDEAHEGTQTELGDAVITALKKENTKVLSLSGTPYNILGEFEENKYTWSYVDEQEAKQKWYEEHPDERNPYEELPTMNIFTFDITNEMPNSYRYVTDDMAFNFHEFFRVWTGDIDKDYREIPTGKKQGDFVYEEDVYNFLTLISKDDPNSNYPFSTEENREMFLHTFWLVPGVKEARALSKMLQSHPRFSDYEVVNIAGDGDEEKDYDEALSAVKGTIAAYPKTITISCGRLTTGVTVREWTGVMMLSGSSSTAASGYMQAIFRVQSPGFINGKQKKNCYVFDFAPDRTLKVIAEVHSLRHKRGAKDDEKAKQILGKFINFCPIIAVEGTVMRTYDVPEMMRQIKRISVEAAINSGFDDDSIYKGDAGIIVDSFDAEILKKLSDVVAPKKKSKKDISVTITDTGMTKEEHEKAKKLQHKPKKELTEEEKELLEKLKQQKAEQRKMFDLLRAVSIRLPLLFYGADADITEIIHLKDFVELVDPESWKEFMPKGLTTGLFLDILRYYDEDVVTAAGLRIRRLAKQADELPPVLRAKRIVEIISRFKNPDKETVLTPWRVVNMHLGDTIGGYNFYDENYEKEIEIPHLIEQGEVTADILLNPQAKILEMNSKSGLYPLYMAYSLYMMEVSGDEKNFPIAKAREIWAKVLKNNIFVLCKTKMARTITIRTLAGYSGADVNAICLSKLIEERMKDIPRLANKLKNPNTWNKEGERMEFDAVVGNPPYQENIGGEGNESLSKQLFPDFIKSAIECSSKYVSLITPSRWFTADAQDKSFVKLREYVKENNHFNKIYNYLDNKDLFSNVSIGSMNYFLYDKSYLGDVEFIECNNSNRHFTKRPLFEKGLDIIISLNKLIEILDKVRCYKDFESLMKITQGRNAFNITGKTSELDSLSKTTKFDNCVELRCAYEEIRYTEVKNITKNEKILKSWKIFTSKGNGGAGTLNDEKAVMILGKSYIGKPMSACTDSLIPIGCFDTEIEAVNLQKYMSTKFLRFMVGILKVSQNVSQNVYQFVPMQDFTNNSDIDWSKSISEIDKQLYKKYNLSEEEIDYIEKMIKPME